MAHSMAHSLFTTNFSLEMSRVWMSPPSPGPDLDSLWMVWSTWRYSLTGRPSTRGRTAFRQPQV